MATEDEIFLAPPDGFPFDPAHPGEALSDELAARGMTAHALALKLRVPANRLTEILNGKREFSPTPPCASAAILAPAPRFG